MSSQQLPDIIGVILAGGLARRMGGGDKPLKSLAGRPILSHIIDRMKPQLSSLVINVNSSEDVFNKFNLPLVKDSIEGFAGPLAGVLAGMDWIAENHLQCRYMVSVPGDGPFVPKDLVCKLIKPILDGNAQMSVATSNGRTQPVIGVWDITLRDDLRRAITEEGIHKVDLWTARYQLAEVEFDAINHDPFFNANKPDDMKKAEEIYRTLNDAFEEN